MDDYLSAKDIQKKLGISKNTAYKLFHTKGFPSIKIGNSLRVSEQKLDNWLDRYTNYNFRI